MLVHATDTVVFDHKLLRDVIHLRHELNDQVATLGTTGAGR